jgi:hypothetical protein
VAVWVIAAPQAFGTFLARWLAPLANAAGVPWHKYLPTAEEIARLAERPPWHGEAVEPDVQVCYQKAGDAVYIRPGYAHLVRNLQACVKFAYDFLRRGELLAAMAAYEVIREHFGRDFNEHISEPSVHVVNAAVHEVIRAGNFVRLCGQAW